MAELEQEISLPDGRILGYARFGASTGKTLVYLHGFPASRLEAGILDGPARRLGVSIIAPDRPGFGRSSLDPGRTILGWPDDLLHLADILGLRRFSVLGGSGGCPYAAACAFRIPRRIVRAGAVAGLGPVSEAGLTRQMGATARTGFFLARRVPVFFDFAYGALARLVKQYPSLIFRLNQATPPDREVLDRPRVRSVLTRSAAEAFRQGTQGAIQEFKLLARPWGFSMEDIAAPFYLWHGERDGTVPHSMAEFIAGKVPESHLRLLPDEGHISLPIRRGPDILRTLLPEG